MDSDFTKSLFWFVRFFLVIGIFSLCMVLWARYSSHWVLLPLPDLDLVTVIIAIYGLVVLVSGLWQKFSSFFMVKHFIHNESVHWPKLQFLYLPSYYGIIILSFCLFALSDSASGYWLVSPLLAVALLGYVCSIKIRSEDGGIKKHCQMDVLAFPGENDGALSWKVRMRGMLLAFIPWAFIYESFILIGVPSDAIYSNIYLDAYIPFLDWTVIFYIATYFFACTVPFIVESREHLKQFVKDVFWCSLISGIIYFALPLVVFQKPFLPKNIFGELLMLDRSLDANCAAFPAFHVIWAWIIYNYYSLRFNRYKILWFLLACAITISCLTTANHSIVDVLAGIAVFLIVKSRMLFGNTWTAISDWQRTSIRRIPRGIYAIQFREVCSILAIFGAAVILYSYACNFDPTLYLLCHGSGICIALLFYYIGKRWTWSSLAVLYVSLAIGVILPAALMHVYLTLPFFAVISPLVIILSWLEFWFSLSASPENTYFSSEGASMLNKFSQDTTKHTTGNYFMAPGMKFFVPISFFFLCVILVRLYTLEVPSGVIAGIYIFLRVLIEYMRFTSYDNVQDPLSLKKLKFFSLGGLVSGAILTCIVSEPILSFTLHMDSYFWIFILISLFGYFLGFRLLRQGS